LAEIQDSLNIFEPESKKTFKDKSDQEGKRPYLKGAITKVVILKFIINPPVS
jgi:hypothetical protein